jgi:deoxyribonuclease-1
MLAITVRNRTDPSGSASGKSTLLLSLACALLLGGCAHAPEERAYAMAAPEPTSAGAEPDFSSGGYKAHADRHLAPIYAETPLEIYCGCKVDFEDGSIDLAQCGYQPETPGSPHNTKMHWEHVVPKSWVAEALECGSPEACRADPRLSDTYLRAENDLYNLVPSVGSLNMKRSNHWLWEVPGEKRKFGACDFEVTRLGSETLIEPPNRNKGNVARITLYYIEQHGIQIPDEALELYLEWHRKDPVDRAEKKRAKAIEAILGHSNPYVTGER